MPNYVDATEAIARFVETLTKRGIRCHPPQTETYERVPHVIVRTEQNDIYHVRYIRAVSSALKAEIASKYAHESGLGERLEYVVDQFGNGDLGYITMNMELAVRLLDEAPHQCFFAVLLADGRMFWRSTEDFYNFAMRYNVVNWQPNNGSIPYAVIPLGWLIPWNDALTAPPAVIDLK
jgi:hypothetical protein